MIRNTNMVSITAQLKQYSTYNNYKHTHTKSWKSRKLCSTIGRWGRGWVVGGWGLSGGFIRLVLPSNRLVLTVRLVASGRGCICTRQKSILSTPQNDTQRMLRCSTLTQGWWDDGSGSGPYVLHPLYDIAPPVAIGSTPTASTQTEQQKEGD